MITEKLRKAALLEQEYFLQNMLQQELELATPINRPSYCQTKSFRAASLSLLRKRARAVSKVFPKTRESLGEAYDVLFRKFVKDEHLSPGENPIVDGLCFARWLQEQKNELNDEASMEILATDLHYSCSAGASIRYLIRIRRLEQSKKWVIGFALQVPLAVPRAVVRTYIF